MSHGSKEAFSEGIGGLAVVIPREMSALVHEVLGCLGSLGCDSDVHVLDAVLSNMHNVYSHWKGILSTSHLIDCRANVT